MLNYKSYYDLSRDIAAGVQLLPEVDIVVGVPKSGIIPATMIASFLNVQMFDLDSFLFSFSPRSGMRRQRIKERDRLRVLIVDDSVNTGHESARVKRRVAEVGGDFDIYFCAVYGVAPGAHENMADIVFSYVPHPRFFQWNYRNHIVAEHALFDMDGVLCVDPPEEKNDDGPLYVDYILNAQPLFIPQKKISAIVTSRLEKYRSETEHWLEQNAVAYGELIMLDLPTAEDRRRLRAHAPFKSKVYAERDEVLFVESNWKQAKAIATSTNKPVICTENDIFLSGAEHVRDLSRQGQLFDIEKADIEGKLRQEVAELTKQVGLARPQLQTLLDLKSTNPVSSDVAPMRKEREIQSLRRAIDERFPSVPCRGESRRLLMIARTFDPAVGAGAAMSSARLRDALSATGAEVFSLTADDLGHGSEVKINQPIFGQNIGYWNHYFDPRRAEILLKHIDLINPDAIIMGAVDNGVVSILDLALIRRPIVWCGRDNWMHTGGCLFKLEPESIAEPFLPDSAFMESLTCKQYQTGCGDCPAIIRPEERAKARAQYILKSRVMEYRKDIVLAPISNWLGKMLHEAPLTANHTIEIVHNAMDLEAVAPSPQSGDEIRVRHSLPVGVPLVLLAAQSLRNPRKGLRLVLDQLSTATKLNSVQFVVMGHSDLDEIPGALRDRFHALGFIKDELLKREIYSAVDAILVPALQESLSVVASDGVAAGKPVVAFSVGGLTDLVVHRKTGFLAPAFDARTLLDGLAWVLFEADREELSIAARHRAFEILDAKINVDRMMAAVDKAIAQFEDLGPLPEKLSETIELMGELQNVQRFERENLRWLQRQKRSGSSAVVEELSTPRNARIFSVKGKLSQRHLTQVHRLVLGTHKSGLWPIINFEDSKWAYETWAGEHLKKLDYVTIIEDLSKAPINRGIEISTTDRSIIFKPSDWSKDITTGSDVYYRNSAIKESYISKILQKLGRSSLPRKDSKDLPGIFTLSESWGTELEILAALSLKDLLVLGRITLPLAVPAGSSGFHKVALPAPKGWEGKLVVYGKLSRENLYELAMIARYLGRDAVRVAELEGVNSFDPETLAQALVANAKPIKLSTGIMPKKFEEAISESLSRLDRALDDGVTLEWEVPAAKM